MNPHPFTSRVSQIAHKVPVPLWAIALMLLPVGAGLFGLWLLNDWETAECQTVGRTVLASESTRLYCAQTIADRDTAPDLAEAIQLTDSISSQHPLRKDGDRLIQRWTSKLLEKAEATFQAGKLEDAIKTAASIPANVPGRDKANTQIEKWQKIWDEAERLFNEAQTAMSDDQLQLSLLHARKLLRVPNQYWNTQRFQELVNQIQATKDSKKLAERDRAKSKALAVKPATTNDIIERWQQEQTAEAATRLARAQQLAASGDSDRLRDAISEAQMIFSSTPQYPQAQKLIEQWNRQIETTEDLPYLDRAEALASKGDILSLQSAISEANNIYFGRALYHKAQRRIDQWTTQVQELSTQPASPQLPPTLDPSFRSNDYQIPQR
jgi:vacuolar-type H+-ATPase subunit I/STV1